jgi:hypothetical protein
MDDIQKLQARISTLESEHEKLLARFIETRRVDRTAIDELYSLVETLEARLKDFDQVEAAAFAAYGKTHEGVKADLDAMNEAIVKAR